MIPFKISNTRFDFRIPKIFWSKNLMPYEEIFECYTDGHKMIDNVTCDIFFKSFNDKQYTLPDYLRLFKAKVMNILSLFSYSTIRKYQTFCLNKIK